MGKRVMTAESKSTERKQQTLKVDKKYIIARQVPVRREVGVIDNGAIYFEIVYHEVGKQYDNVGFGSYYLDNVLKWSNEELELVSTEKH